MAPYKSSCLSTLRLPRVVWEVNLRLEVIDCVSLCSIGSDSKSTALYLVTLGTSLQGVGGAQPLSSLQASGIKMRHLPRLTQ